METSLSPTLCATFSWPTHQHFFKKFDFLIVTNFLNNVTLNYKRKLSKYHYLYNERRGRWRRCDAKNKNCENKIGLRNLTFHSILES